MSLSPTTRRAVLVAHLTSTVGWMGAVAAYLVLAVIGLRAADPQQVRGVYLAMGALAWWLIAPACGLALVTGLAQAFGTAWGLARHYWIVFKLLLTLFAAFSLAVHLQPTDLMSHAAAAGPLQSDAFVAVRRQLVIAPAAALVLLLTNVVLGVVKPKGVTAWGGRRSRRGPQQPSPKSGT